MMNPDCSIVTKQIIDMLKKGYAPDEFVYGLSDRFNNYLKREGLKVSAEFASRASRAGFRIMEEYIE